MIETTTCLTEFSYGIYPDGKNAEVVNVHSSIDGAVEYAQFQIQRGRITYADIMMVSPGADPFFVGTVSRVANTEVCVGYYLYIDGRADKMVDKDFSSLEKARLHGDKLIEDNKATTVLVTKETFEAVVELRGGG